MADDRGLDPGSFGATGANFSPGYSRYSATQGQGDAIVTLSPNVPTRITVWIEDTDGLEARDSIDVTYVPLPPPPTRGVKGLKNGFQG